MKINSMFKLTDIGRVSSLLLFRAKPLTSRVITINTNLRQYQFDEHGNSGQNGDMRGLTKGMSLYAASRHIFMHRAFVSSAQAQRKDVTEKINQSGDFAQNSNSVLSSQVTASASTEHFPSAYSNDPKLNGTLQNEATPGYPVPEHLNMKFVDPSSHFAHEKGNRGPEYDEQTHDEAFRRQQQIQDTLRKESMRKFLKQFLMAFGFVLTAHAFLFIMAKKQGVFELERVRDSEGKVVRVLPTEVVEEIALETGSSHTGLPKGVSQKVETEKPTDKSLELSAPNVVAGILHSRNSTNSDNLISNNATAGAKQTWGEYIWSFYPLSWMWPSTPIQLKQDTQNLQDINDTVALNPTETIPANIPLKTSSEELAGQKIPLSTLQSEVDEQRQMDLNLEAAIERLAASSNLDEARSIETATGSHPRVIRVRAPRFAVRRESLLMLQDDDEDEAVVESALKSLDIARS